MAERPDPLIDLIAACTRRMRALAHDGVARSIATEFRGAAASVARQAAGEWTVEAIDGHGFRMRTHDRRILFSRGFADQVLAIIDGLRASEVPKIRSIMHKLGADASDQPIIGAFFSFFAAHELLHVEQGLGSDQYTDTDDYMPAVMQADYVADISGLAICLEADIEEIRTLSRHERALLLAAIHIFSMHSFVTDTDAMDADTFQRLSIWYLHFARIDKAPTCPALDAPSFSRFWVVMFPRLVAAGDRGVTRDLLDKRSKVPIAAKSDILLAYHRDDGLYRLHRALLTADDRAESICRAILAARFDDVRADLEELLLEYPSLVAGDDPASQDLEWRVAATLAALAVLREAAVNDDGNALEEAFHAVRLEAAWLTGAVKRSAAARRAARHLDSLRTGLDRIDKVLSVAEGRGRVVTREIGRLYLPLDGIRSALS